MKSLAAAAIALAGMMGLVAILLLAMRAGSINAVAIGYLAAAAIGITALTFRRSSSGKMNTAIAWRKNSLQR